MNSFTLLNNARLRTIRPDKVQTFNAGPLTDYRFEVNDWGAVQVTTNDLTPGRVMVKVEDQIGGKVDTLYTTQAKAIEIVMVHLGWAKDGVEQDLFRH